MLLTPAVIGLLVLYVYPLLWELNVSFTKMSLRNFVDPGFLGLNTEKGNIFVGFQNYIDVFTKPVLQQTSFYQLFAQTVIWTAINIFFHVDAGRAAGADAQPQAARPDVLPGAAHPAVGDSRRSHRSRSGAPSSTSSTAPSTRSWTCSASRPSRGCRIRSANFAAMIITNVWLGVPFMMVITLGGLQSISQDYYEAADLDGATDVPVVPGHHRAAAQARPACRPILLGMFLTFNNILVPFFINQNEPDDQ